MKYLKRISLFITVIAVPIFSNAQYHDIKINVSNVLLFEFMGAYEYSINDNMSISALGGYVYGLPGSNADAIERRNKKFTKYAYVGPEFRYYVNPYEGTDGFFIGGYMRYKTGFAEAWFEQNGQLPPGHPEYDPNNNGYFYQEALVNQDFQKISLGVVFGGKWVLDNGLTLELFGGFGRNLVANYSDASDYGFVDPDDFIEGTYYDNLDITFWDSPYWDFRAGFCMGYRFGN